MIATQPDLSDLLAQVQTSAWAALDTEADSLHAYPEKLCLLQISLQGRDVLIDPLAKLDLGPLLRCLGQKRLILHGADYDLRLLYRSYGFVPAAVFDTMWAARLLGCREYGLRSLVQQHLGVALEKGPQKMNWALRPLSERMSAYALNDTRHLQPLAEILRKQLHDAGRLAWQEEVCARVVQECARSRTPDPDSLWRVKGSDRLDRKSMAVLVELWRWREEEALAANRPPYFVLSHETLVALAAAVSQGRPAQHLIPHHLPAKRAVRLREAIQRGLQVPPSAYPQPRRAVGVRLNKEQQIRFDHLKRVRDRQAQTLDLDPTVIASKADLVRLAQHHQQDAEMMGWQRHLLGLGRVEQA